MRCSGLVLMAATPGGGGLRRPARAAQKQAVPCRARCRAPAAVRPRVCKTLEVQQDLRHPVHDVAGQKRRLLVGFLLYTTYLSLPSAIAGGLVRPGRLTGPIHQLWSFDIDGVVCGVRAWGPRACAFWRACDQYPDMGLERRWR